MHSNLNWKENLPHNVLFSINTYPTPIKPSLLNPIFPVKYCWIPK